MMQYQTLYSSQRVGSGKTESGARSGFQRDYDRIIFSSAFRRLQNKTQVFPLPGTAFVHNRLTHSLEVASVGRSLGKMVGEQIATGFKGHDEHSYEFYKYELANVIGAACLAHDIGNPAFGHSGEKAIAHFFLTHAHQPFNGISLQQHFTAQQWQDLVQFEGNAAALRILTHSFRGRFTGGFGLTYTTIAALLKYPCASTAVDKTWVHRKKWGFFESETAVMHTLAHTLGMPLQQAQPVVYGRHPFVYLTEAADDICYSVIDVEDAHRLGILQTPETKTLLLDALRRVSDALFTDKTIGYLKALDDANEGIAFLRARLINALTTCCVDLFLQNKNALLNASYNNSLVDAINADTGVLKDIAALSREKIYGHDTVLQIELAGFNVMSELLGLFVPALLHTHPDAREKKLLRLFPYQFTAFEETEDAYIKVLCALDFISGMTDEYATELYRRLKGISVPHHA